MAPPLTYPGRKRHRINLSSHSSAVPAPPNSRSPEVAPPPRRPRAIRPGSRSPGAAQGPPRALKRRRRQSCAARVQVVAVELLRLCERLRLRPSVRWIARTLREEYRLQVGDRELRAMLDRFVRVSHDRRRLRRLSAAEAAREVLDYCARIESAPSARWLGRFLRQALGFPIDNNVARELQRTYCARPPHLTALRRTLRARPAHLRPAIGKGSPIGVISLVPSTKLAREVADPAPDPGKLNTKSAMQMLLELEPRLIPGKDGLTHSDRGE
jgi:hypothetical protein